VLFRLVMRRQFPRSTWSASCYHSGIVGLRSAAVVIDQQLLRRWPLPKLAADADKQARGDVLVVGGSRELPGPVILAGVAALRAGAGRVRLGVARSIAVAVGTSFPEARVIGLSETRRGELASTAFGRLGKELGEFGTLLIGPGMRDGAAATPLLGAALESESDCCVVLDAAALRVLRGRSPLGGNAADRVIATPHAGEMADVWGCTRDVVEKNPLQLATEAARKLRVTLVLKGVRTVVATPAGNAFINANGNSGLATSGSGDTLSGLIAGLAARGAQPAQAAVWGVYLHSAAGDALKRKQGPLGYLARDLAAEVPALLAQIEKQSRRRRSE
jgi:ADP-dependent NAD(P)H-hydrate dehydratase